MNTFTDPLFVQRLAATILSGPWDRDELHSRVFHAFPDDRPLVAKIVDMAWILLATIRPSQTILERFIYRNIEKQADAPKPRRRNLRKPKMTPRWGVPNLATPGQLADWLDLPHGQLEWFADLRGLTVRQPETKLRHYVTLAIPRSNGKSRLLEIPKPRLKAIQRHILREIVSKISPHDAAHGFRPQRSILTFVEGHVSKRMVMRFDLRDFFASVSAPRVQGIFREAGYPTMIAKVLAGLCTTRTPDDLAPGPRWRTRHLPQGAPTSPALANLAAFRLDVRLQALAAKLGASYSRYADDLAFSGNIGFERAARRVQVLVAVIAGEEGFDLNTRKSRFMRQSVRQQLVGVVVNDQPNINREAYDELKATLHNCVRHGPESQNRERHGDFRGHLLGRIAHVRNINPTRGAKLHAAFERIQWPAIQ